MSVIFGLNIITISSQLRDIGNTKDMHIYSSKIVKDHNFLSEEQ